MTPDALRLAEALGRSAPLVRLRQLIAESNARLVAIRSSLPGALADHVAAGPVDEEGWSLLAENAAVAAKLRQLRPRLEDTLREQGLPVRAIRIKVQTR